MPSKVLQTDYHIGEHEETLKVFELRTINNSLKYLLPTLKNLPSSFKLLDVGCGPASITIGLAQLFPDAHIIGIDQSAAVIERNKATAVKVVPGSKIEFRIGNILQPETFLSEEEIGSFDVVNEHTTLIHIPNNVEALRQMRRIAKAEGGIVASRNGDLKSQILHPPCPDYEKFISSMYALASSDITTGRKIIAKAIAAGWTRRQIQESASILRTSDLAERKIWASSMLKNLDDGMSDVRKCARELGYNDDDLGLVRSDMENFGNAEDGWRLVICCEIICKNGAY